MSHGNCANVACRAPSYANYAAGSVPPLDETYFVVHVWTGPSHAVLNQRLTTDLPIDQAYLIQPGVCARFYREPGFPDQVRLHLFGIVGGLSLAHSLGSAQDWFHGGQQLINQLAAAQVRGIPASARLLQRSARQPSLRTTPQLHVAHLNPCWDTDLSALHESVQATVLRTMSSGSYEIPYVPDNWYAAPDPTRAVAQAS
jgi:hypothetical protein